MTPPALRAAVFVDAGHVIAHLGQLLHRTTERAALAVDHEALASVLRAHVAQHGGAEILRTYWYDAPPPGGDAHAELPALPGITIRFGQLVGGRQKRVDAMLVADMVRLAWTGAVAAAYLVAQDDDLLPAVASAKDAGARVVLVELAASSRSHLRAEADAALLVPLEALRDTVRLRAAPPASPGALTDPATTAYAVAREFAARWLLDADQTTVHAVQQLLGSGGRIPVEIDAKLLDATEQHVGRAVKQDAVRQRMRDGFCEEIANAAGRANGASAPHPARR
jgi:hypothetical protein